MRRVCVMVAILLAALPALAMAASADVPLLGFSGYDYHLASPASTHYLDVGDAYFSLGLVTSFDATLLGGHFDTSLNEYTFILNGLTVNASYYSGGFLEADFANPGARARFYEDALASGTHGEYGVAPENSTAPSTFTDGVIALGGQISSFVVTYNFGTDQGTFSGSIDFDEGSDLAFIPAAQRSGWTFGGIAGSPLVPQGYDHQVTGQCQVPSVTPVAHVTWGEIKSLYRR
jgi:hypothetical protein